MPHWLQAIVAVGGAVASWRWIIRPLRRGVVAVTGLLQQIRTSNEGVNVLTREVQALAGAVVRLVLAVLDDTASLRNEHQELRRNQEELTRMVVDLEGDVRRLDKNRRSPR